jgi:hypothetical protein
VPRARIADLDGNGVLTLGCLVGRVHLLKRPGGIAMRRDVHLQ